MHVFRLLAPTLCGAALVAAPAANAELVTIGSDLKAPATVTEAHGADTAFWETALAGGRNFRAPEQGQVVAIRLKGSVLKEPGAADPLNEVHFQSLIPQSGGRMKVGCTPRTPTNDCGTSNPVRVPIDGDPNQITTYDVNALGNLCIDKGGSVAFNDEGGFKYGGPGQPLDENHYWQGAPFRVFGEVAGSSTAQYTANDGTNTGATLHPTVVAGQELLMQVVIATGDDRSYFCGGPARDASGNVIVPAEQRAAYVKLVAAQRPYIPSSRRTRVGVYCYKGCAGRAVMLLKAKKKKRIASSTFGFSQGAGFIDFRVSKSAYRKLRRSKQDRLPVVIRLLPTGGLAKTVLKTFIRR